MLERLLCPIRQQTPSQTPHLLSEPRMLPCCGRSACRECIIAALDSKSATINKTRFFSCPLCQITSKVALNKEGTDCLLDKDAFVSSALDSRLDELSRFVVDKLDATIKSYKG